MKRHLLIFLLFIGAGSIMAQKHVSDLTAGVVGANIKWYNATGIEYLGTDVLVNGTTYYASQTVNGVESSSKLAVLVAIFIPGTPTEISGTSVQSPSKTLQIYSTALVTGATIYNWTVPDGWTITGGVNTNSITVTTGNVGQNGNISVTAANDCGTSSPLTLGVTIPE